jgi:hypothetical protein
MIRLATRLGRARRHRAVDAWSLAGAMLAMLVLVATAAGAIPSGAPGRRGGEPSLREATTQQGSAVTARVEGSAPLAEAVDADRAHSARSARPWCGDGGLGARSASRWRALTRCVDRGPSEDARALRTTLVRAGHRRAALRAHQRTGQQGDDEDDGGSSGLAPTHTCA